MKMKINVDKSLIKAVKTGKVIIGANRTVDAAENGSAKMVVLASNCPADIKKKFRKQMFRFLNTKAQVWNSGPYAESRSRLQPWQSLMQANQIYLQLQLEKKELQRLG